MSREDANRVVASVSAMPTTDPGLNVSAGSPPLLAKVGDADPTQIQNQRTELEATIAEQRRQGAADAAAPAGENDVRDRSPREHLRAPELAVPGAAGSGAVAPTHDGAVGIIAEQKQGGEVRAAMARARDEMTARRAAHQGKVAEEKAKSNAEITALRQENASQQQAEKAKVQAEVATARGAWSAEQNAELIKTNEKAGAEISKGNEKIAKEEAQANSKAAEHISQGEIEAGEHRARAEKQASEKKRDAERQQQEDSGGIFGWIASKVSAFFQALKSAITQVFEAAKKLVQAAIDKAKQLAVEVIERARQAVVGLIKAVGAALMALGDALLAAFPGLRKKWRAFIESRVKAAEEGINKLAAALKQGITKLLDGLGKAFAFLLDAYRKAMLAVLDVAKAVAMAAIKGAKAYADAVGTFAVLIKDIAAGPGRWIANLRASVMDGIRNHLWEKFQTGVKDWFHSKLEQVLGVGTTIWNVLKQGGITLKQVGQMAFEALKAAIPAALIQLLIEKLVAMIVPAAGAVLVIVEGLQAAWPAIQRIMAAAGAFLVFLKAVKDGGAGPQFAALLAAGAVVLIDFVANWLLKKLRGPASRVGAKVKAIAQKIMARIKKALKKGLGWVKGKLKGLKKKFDAWKAKRKAKKDAKKKEKEDPSKKKQEKEKAKQERLHKAVEAIRPQVQSMASKGKFSGLIFRAKLLFWQAKYRLSSLAIRGSNGLVQLEAKVNPSANVMAFVRKNGRELRKIIYEVGREIMEREDVGAAEKRLQEQMEKGAGRKQEERLELSSGVEAVALAKIMRKERERGTTFVQFSGGGKASVTRKERRPTDKALLGPGNQVVNKAGDYDDHISMFSTAATRDPWLSKSGGRSREVQAMATVTMLSGGSPHRDQKTRDFAARQALLRITEMSRNDQALVVSSDLAQLHGQGMIDHSTALRDDPMAPVGAVSTSRNLEAKTMGTQSKTSSQGDVNLRANASKLKQMREQQLKYIAGIMEAKYGAENVMFKSESAVTEAVRADVKATIKQIAELNLGLSNLP
ncbi:MAG: hypothetical protein ACK587_16880 [Cyanobacteriota bacterium]